MLLAPHAFCSFIMVHSGRWSIPVPFAVITV
nr:MAG TPA: hypothetical protein [Caudoviricetes sp.]